MGLDFFNDLRILRSQKVQIEICFIISVLRVFLLYIKFKFFYFIPLIFYFIGGVGYAKKG